MKDYLAELKEKIRLLHGCEATHRQSVSVKEVFQGKTAWDGDVEVFDLIGHAKAKRCYAWGYPSDKLPGELVVVAVLEIPPVVSPETAVKVAIAAQIQSSKALESCPRVQTSTRIPATLLDLAGQILAKGEAEETSPIGGTFWPIPPVELGSRQYDALLLEMRGTQVPVFDFRFCDKANYSVHYHFHWTR